MRLRRVASTPSEVVPHPVAPDIYNLDESQARYETGAEVPEEVRLELRLAERVADVKLSRHKTGTRELALLVTGMGAPHLWVVEGPAGLPADQGFVIHYNDRIIGDALTVIDAIRSERQSEGFKEKYASLSLKYGSILMDKIHKAVSQRQDIVKGGIFLD